MQNLSAILNRRTLIIAGIVLVALALLGLGAQRLQGFQLISSKPSGNSENQFSPVEFTFTQDLAPTNNDVNQIVFSPQINGTTIVSGKTVHFDPLEPYDPDDTYTVTLKGPTSKSGSVLKDIQISFRATYVDPSKLPAKYQTPKEDEDKPTPYTAGTIIISGSAALLSHGLTSEQIELLQEDFYLYFRSVNQEHRLVSLTNMVQHVPGPTGSGPDYFTFNVVIDGKTAYLGRMEYGLVSVRLILTNPQSKAVVYDTDNYDPDQAGGNSEETP